jgi:hypothetical protein
MVRMWNESRDEPSGLLEKERGRKRVGKEPIKKMAEELEIAG